MRLRQYTLKNLSIPLLIILSIWAYAFYATLTHKIDEETDESLMNHKMLIIKSALADSTLLQDHVDVLTQYYIHEIPESEADLSMNQFFDSTRVVPLEMISVPIRGLRTCFRSSNDKFYQLTIITSILEKEEMVNTMIVGLTILYVSLIICILLVIHWVFRKSLRPLYTLFDWLKKYRLGKTNIPLRNETKIEEFHILNDTLEEFINRSSQHYNMQKQFIENASHELQTPLAICMNKLELMSENPTCSEQQLMEYAELHKTLTGIAKMNRSLLLLSRIENKQYLETATIHFNSIIRNKLEDFSEMYVPKQIQVVFEESDQLYVTMNESLASTLITNLIKNAYIHNIENGFIQVTTTSHTLQISNTSESPRLNSTTLFGRYNRQSKLKESTGLGLAIVKSISNRYETEITYEYQEEKKLHTFILTFK